jgi:hypothetical protein
VLGLLVWYQQDAALGRACRHFRRSWGTWA